MCCNYVFFSLAVLVFAKSAIEQLQHLSLWFTSFLSVAQHRAGAALANPCISKIPYNILGIRSDTMGFLNAGLQEQQLYKHLV